MSECVMMIDEFMTGEKSQFTKFHLSNTDSHRIISLIVSSTNLAPIDPIYVPILLQLDSCGSDSVNSLSFQHIHF